MASPRKRLVQGLVLATLLLGAGQPTLAAEDKKEPSFFEQYLQKRYCKKTYSDRQSNPDFKSKHDCTDYDKKRAESDRQHAENMYKATHAHALDDSSSNVPKGGIYGLFREAFK